MYNALVDRDMVYGTWRCQVSWSMDGYDGDGRRLTIESSFGELTMVDDSGAIVGAGQAPTLLKTSTTSDQHGLGPILCRANTTSAQHGLGPALLSASTT